jgi:hypothetical protein
MSIRPAAPQDAAEIIRRTLRGVCVGGDAYYRQNRERPRRPTANGLSFGGSGWR